MTAPPDPGRRTLPDLTQLECWELLRRAELGRLARTVGGEPVVVPVRFTVVGEELLLGAALDVDLSSGADARAPAAGGCSAVALQVDELAELDDGGCTGWSVTAVGSVLLLRDAQPGARPDATAAGALRGPAATAVMSVRRLSGQRELAAPRPRSLRWRSGAVGVPATGQRSEDRGLRPSPVHLGPRGATPGGRREPPTAPPPDVAAGPRGRCAPVDDRASDALTLAEVVELTGWLGVPAHPLQD